MAVRSQPTLVLRPVQLSNGLPPSELRDKLQACQGGSLDSSATEFSIAHRGAPLGYPEHTKQGYIAAAKMGAGVIECDVTFTADNKLVCRHSQCDLHSTTNILETDLAASCTSGFTPSTSSTPASAKCCTSDITLAQFRTLCGRRDRVNAQATNVHEYLNVAATPWEDPGASCGTLMTHQESIKLINKLGRSFTPELKAADGEHAPQGHEPNAVCRPFDRRLSRREDCPQARICPILSNRRC